MRTLRVFSYGEDFLTTDYQTKSGRVTIRRFVINENGSVSQIGTMPPDDASDD